MGDLEALTGLLGFAVEPGTSSPFLVAFGVVTSATHCWEIVLLYATKGDILSISHSLSYRCVFVCIYPSIHLYVCLLIYLHQ